ncbi:unnamed protein product [Rhizoctonia solani]|nr:unnamed protein product [Rhizoctonia solani]
MPRLNKRQQRELEELQQLEIDQVANETRSDVPEAEEEEAEKETEVTQGTSKFDILMADEDDKEESEEEAAPAAGKKSKKKKKKKKSAPVATVQPSTTSKTTSQNKSKPAAGKAGKNKSGKDEIDLALEELAEKLPHLRTSGKVAQHVHEGLPSATSRALFSLLSASLKDFDSEAEMRRFFGSKVVNSSKPAQRASKVSRSHLTRPTQQWGQAGTPHGLSMVSMDDYERRRKGYTRDGEQWWNVEHSVDYKRTQLKFLNCVTLSEPSALFALYRSEPWHIDALLQIGEIMKHQEELSQAADFVERAIYAFEHAFPVAFDISAGSSRLDFDRIENRPLFLALHRHVLSLSRRGTPRTAFEFARLLFALDPIGDPHGAAFYLDYLSAKGGMGQWLLDMWDLWPEIRKEIADNPLASHGIDIRCLPGWAYTRALIVYDQEAKKRGTSHEESTAALKEAILAFPEVVPYLVDKAGINLPGSVRAHDSLKIMTQYTHDDPVGSTLHMLGHLYALRANSLWKNEPHSVWLTSTVTSIQAQLGTTTSARVAASQHFAHGPSEAMARHSTVADLRAISAYCRPGTFPPITHAYDPLAPSTSLSYYDETYFQDIPRGQPSTTRTASHQHMPGGFEDDDGDAVNLEDVDPQVLLNHFLDQAQENGNASLVQTHQPSHTTDLRLGSVLATVPTVYHFSRYSHYTGAQDLENSSRDTMDPTIEENSIKPVNKLRERFEALAASSSTKSSSLHANDHEDVSTGNDTTPNASPRRNGLSALRPSSMISSPGRSSSLTLKKGSESDPDDTPTPTQNRASPPSINRKLGLKPPPPPPPERTSTLKSKSSTDSVNSTKWLAPAGVHRKPPPPPPAHGQYGHMASLSVGDLVQINTANTPSIRSLDASPIGTPGILLPLDGQIRRSPSPMHRDLLNPSPSNGQAPPVLPIRINIPDTLQVESSHNGFESGDPARSAVKRFGPPRSHVVFTPSTPGSPAPPLPSRTSPDSLSSKNTVAHHTLPRRTDTLNPQVEVDEFGLGRSPPPRHHSLSGNRSMSASIGRPPPPPPPRPSSVISPVSAITPQTGITNLLIDAPPPLPNRRSNPNLRSEVIPLSASPISAAPAPAPPTTTRPMSSTWSRLAGLKAWATHESSDHGSFKPPPPPTRTIALGDKLPPPRRVSADDSSDSEDDPSAGHLSANPAARKLQDDMPDSSQSRRCPPTFRPFTPVHVPSHGAVVATAGHHICVAHTVVEIYDAQKMPSPQFTIDLEYLGIEWRSKEPRVTAMEFRSGETRDDDGRYLWCGGKDGHLFELDVWTGHVTDILIPSGGHSLTVIHILRYGDSMLTMDESGKIIVFEPSEDRLAPALSRFTRSHRTAEKQTFAKILGGHLWTSAGTGGGGSTTSARGTPFRTYDLSAANFTTKHLFPSEPVGPALCGAIIPELPDRVYIGHEGGCVSIWKYDAPTCQHVCVQMVKLSASSLISMEGVGSRLWLGTRSGTITVCEVREDSPWIVTNQWQAHGDSPVAHIAVDPYSISKIGQLIVYSVGRDDRMLFWDGFIEYNWIDDEMQKREREYSTYRDMKVLICTWNIDSAKPEALTGNRDNTSFLDNVLASVDRPDIIVFGFQEIIDLENKKLTAKTVLLGSQKSKTEKISEKVSRSYKLWYDRLVLAVRLAMPPDDPYTVIHSENLVGLFTCIFVRNSERISVTDAAITTIKRGMKGRYGNKGAIIARFTLDDTSFCFLNCHLAAGQKHTRERNQDLAAIFEEKSVFPYASQNVSATAYVGGGDGTMILDHEVVFLNGDLNYRIDQRRELVIQSIQAGDIHSLLANDQLLKEMHYNPGFRLRPFTEPPITFMPTYKYDRGSNEFDSSEKRRIPAWCDRILYRSRGDRVHSEHYKRYEPNVSDHRPVSGGFRVEVKSVNRDAWNIVKARVQEEWQERQGQLLWISQDFYTGSMSKLLT